ncbi:MAG: hypothetical protein AAF235_10300, partial [Planctomycetota bacterium]
MFHRRLLLVAAAFTCATGAMAAQLAILTLAEHKQHLANAESKLIERRWTPTLRGRILDRSGRVLAQDRPGYAAAIDYRVLNGAWAGRQARSLAARAHPDTWPDADPATRDRLEAAMLARLEAHAGAMWDRLARTVNVDRTQLEDTASRIVARVQRARSSVVEARRLAMLNDRVEAGLPMTDQARDEIAQRARIPIREEREAHVVIGGLPDAIGFDLVRLAHGTLELARPRGRDPVTIPLMPGLEVVDTADRVYPFETIAATIDRRTLPSPLRDSMGEEGFEQINVTGLARLVVGEMRRGPRADDIDRRAQQRSDTESNASQNGVQSTNTVDRGRYRPGDLVGHR